MNKVRGLLPGWISQNSYSLPEARKVSLLGLILRDRSVPMIKLEEITCRTERRPSFSTFSTIRNVYFTRLETLSIPSKLRPL
jgi:hypothetical protein